MQDLEATLTQVLGISIDSPPANARFAKDIGVTFPLLSDMRRDVARAYGILNDEMQVANRTTFVVDTSGVIRHIEAGRSAIDPAAALGVCTEIHRGK